MMAAPSQLFWLVCLLASLNHLSTCRAEQVPSDATKNGSIFNLQKFPLSLHGSESDEFVPEELLDELVAGKVELGARRLFVKRDVVSKTVKKVERTVNKAKKIKKKVKHAIKSGVKHVKKAYHSATHAG